MNVTDKINELLKLGVAQITIAEVPEHKGELFIKATQVVGTGPNRVNHMELVHQVSGEGVPEMLDRIGKQAAHVHQLKGLVVDLKR